MRIGVLAKRAGVSTSSIRFYERRGLLPAPERLPSGYREYDGRALEIILFINQARGLGFNLAEIAAHIHSPKDSSRTLKLLSSMEKRCSAGRPAKPPRSPIRGNRRIATPHGSRINQGLSTTIPALECRRIRDAEISFKTRGVEIRLHPH